MILDNKAIKHIHCMGIGGIGVSGIAEVLHAMGYRVSGCDTSENKIIERLRTMGIEIFIGHDSEHLNGVDCIVYSSAVAADNEEFMEAEKRGIPTVKRGVFLAELMQAYEGIAVAGTHGKTTTSSMMAHVLMEGGFDPSFVIGGICTESGGSARLGQSSCFIAEADESDASFLYLNPKLAVVTNIDADHMGTYGNDFERLKDAFLTFLDKLPEDGVAILGIDDPVVRELHQKTQSNVITVGFSEDADVRVMNYTQDGLFSCFDVLFPSGNTLPVRLNMPGRHNVLNALTVIAVADKLGVKVEALQQALTNFPGVGRRFTAHGELALEGGSALLFEDYGHHPNEIKATLEAARMVWPSRRLVLVFQPHRYTRTHDLFEEFVKVLSLADVLVLLDVYSAGEAVIPEATGGVLCEQIESHGKLTPHFVPELSALSVTLMGMLRADDVVLFQGAGSVGLAVSQLKECA